MCAMVEDPADAFLPIFPNRLPCRRKAGAALSGRSTVSRRAPCASKAQAAPIAQHLDRIERAVEPSGPLEIAHQPSLPVESGDAARLGNGQGIALQPGLTLTLRTLTRYEDLPNPAYHTSSQPPDWL
jgi:hypothetical protein